MIHFIFLLLCLFVQGANSVHVNKDHSLDYYHFPSEIKNTDILHDIEAANIEDAEDDDEDYEESELRTDKKLNLVDKLKFDQKISANVLNNQANNLQHDSQNIKQTNATTTDLPFMIPSNSTTLSNNSNSTNQNVKHLNTTSSKSSGQLIIGLQLYKGLTNTTRRTGQNVELRCVFKCIKNAAFEKCDIKPSNVKWTKNEGPLKNQKNKIEITFSRRKNDYKDIVSKLNIYKLDTHDKGFYKCELKYNRQIVDSVGVLQINDQDDTLDNSLKIETAIRANFDELDDGSSLNPNHYEPPSLANMDLFEKGESTKLFSANSMDYLTVPDKEQCLPYREEICSQYLENQTVVYASSERHRVLTKRLHNLVGLISDFKVTYHCLRFAMSALCHYTFPLCERHQDLIIKRRTLCREDCEMLEHSICKTEYELAKLQNIMNDAEEGILPNCNRLPIAGSKEAQDCIHLDLPNILTSTIIEEESCFHDNGRLYRGKVSTTMNGQRCEAWSGQNLMSIGEYPELHGHNYCRNPGGSHKAPYCIVADGNSWRKEICDLEECRGDRLFLIVSPALIACLLFSLVVCSCCSYRWYNKSRKSKNKKCNIVVPAIESAMRSSNTSYSTIQAAAQQRLLASLNNSSANLFSNSLANHTNGDLNLISMNKYGITYLPPSNIELNSLLANSSDYQPNSCYQLENGENYQISNSNNLLNNLNAFRSGGKSVTNKKVTNSNKNQPAPILKHYPIECIVFLEELGEGAFGKVYKGELTLNNGPDSNLESVIPVAIKTLKEDANSRFKIDFRHEAELMADLKHPNIVALMGVCFDAHPMMLFEFMSQGDLHRYLLNHSPVTNTFMPISSTSNYSYPNQNSNSTNSISNFSNSTNILELNDFLHIATQVAAGMEYLSLHHYVHRDLSSRNCLVSDHLTIKIADFGLSRDVYSQDYYRVQSRSLLPVRWMPVEAILYGRFSVESDCWSFGVLLWEIFTFGMQPYYGKNNQEVIEMIRSRNLLDCPDNCPVNIYSLMLECWSEQPCKRPSFSEIHSRLRNLKAVYSNNSACVTASSTYNNNLNNSAYEVFDEPEENGHETRSNNLAQLNLSHKSRNQDQLISNPDSNQLVVNSNSCGNLLHQHTSDPTSETYLNDHYNNSPCINKLSIFKHSKTVDKNLDCSEQTYQQPLMFNHYKNINSPMINSTGNLCARANSNRNDNFAKLSKNFSFSNNIQRHIKSLKSKDKEVKSNSSFKLNERKS